jgi:hypothetical protein
VEQVKRTVKLHLIYSYDLIYGAGDGHGFGVNFRTGKGMGHGYDNKKIEFYEVD